MAYFVIDWEPRISSIAQHVPASTYTSGQYVKDIFSGEQYYRVFKCILNTAGGEAITNTTYWTEVTHTDADEFSSYVTDQLMPSWGGMNIPRRPRTLEAQLGDGYAQVQQDGLNLHDEQFTLRFQGISGTNAKSIELWASSLTTSSEFQFYVPDPIATTWDLRFTEWSLEWVEWNKFNATLTVKRTYGFFG